MYGVYVLDQLLSVHEAYSEAEEAIDAEEVHCVDDMDIRRVEDLCD